MRHLEEIKKMAGARLNCETLYVELCLDGQWKHDLEESDLMKAFIRTWWKEGIRVQLVLEDFVCTPPFSEEANLRCIELGRFDPSKWKAPEKVEEDEDNPEFDHWKHGEPTWEMELEPLEWEDLPRTLLKELLTELQPALSMAILN